MTTHTSVAHRIAYLATAFLLFTITISAQPTWTQITMPNVGACSYTAGGTADPSYCNWGSVVEPSSQPAWPSPSSPIVMENPGTGNSSSTSGVYEASCYYPNGYPGEAGGPNLWWYAPPIVQPGYQCGGIGPLYFLRTAFIDETTGGWGVEVNASFQGSTDSGQAAIFYSDDQSTTGGREYGLQYVWNSPTQSNFMVLKWSHNTNCGPCYTNSSYTGTPLSEAVNGCVVNTDTSNGGLDVTTAYIYDIWFQLVGGVTPTVYCQIKDASSLTALTTNYFRSTALDGTTTLTWDSTNHWVSAQVD